MFYCNAHKNFYKEYKENFFVLPFCVFVFLFLFITQQSFGINDTTKIVNQKYDLNDARNPDCPCHKYQQLAEKEFAKNIKSNLANATSKMYTKKFTKFPKQILWIRKIKFYFIRKQNSKIKLKRNNAICFKW